MGPALGPDGAAPRRSPRMGGKLTVKAVESLIGARVGRTSNPGRYTDGDGLHLHIRRDGRAAWVLRFRLHGRQRDMGLGGYPAVGLAQARRTAAEARALVAIGLDPVRRRQQARDKAFEEAASERSFRAVALSCIEAKRAGWRNAKHAAQWTATLDTYAFPLIGDIPVSEVGPDDVLRVLRPIWMRIPETASRVRGRIEAVLDHARARGWRAGENPARWRGLLAELLPAPRKVTAVEHYSALPSQQVPAFLASLRHRRGVAAFALRFAILTAARTGEVRAMTWRELDFEARVWTIPARRMKGGRRHRVPLAEPVLALLREFQSSSGAPDPNALVFPGGQAERPLSDMGLSMLVRGMCVDGLSPGARPRWCDADARAVVPHGFRSSFKDWSRTHRWPDHLSELALAHSDRDKVRAAYARDDLFDERRGMMEAWATWCSGEPERRR